MAAIELLASASREVGSGLGDPVDVSTYSTLRLDVTASDHTGKYLWFADIEIQDSPDGAVGNAGRWRTVETFTLDQRSALSRRLVLGAFDNFVRAVWTIRPHPRNPPPEDGVNFPMGPPNPTFGISGEAIGPDPE